MSIRPVDLQVLIPRATEVSRNQQAVEQQLNAQQQYFAQQWQQISASRQQKVQNTPKTLGGKVHCEKEDSKQKQSMNQRRRQLGENVCEHDDELNDSNREEPQDPIKGHLIDIKT